MILISTSTEIEQQISSLIAEQAGLEALVRVSSSLSPFDATIVVEEETITVNLLWKNDVPPVLFNEYKFSQQALLGIIYSLLGNAEAAFDLLKEIPQLVSAANLLNALQNGYTLHEEQFNNSNDYIALHNHAVALHYGLWQKPVSETIIHNAYVTAIENAPTLLYKAYTVKHYVILLMDAGHYPKAQHILNILTTEGLSKEAITEINALKSSILLQTSPPIAAGEDLQQLKTLLSQNLDYYEAGGRDIEVAETLYNAAYVALLESNFSAATGYINRSIALYRENEIPELEAQAQLRKARILTKWSQSGNPQFYRGIIQAYQEAMKVFTRTDAPQVFADIQHQLGIVYAEIPDEVKKKGIWASVSVASFNEALSFYNKIDYPYQFGIICNNLGDAYTKFPKAMYADNYDKSLAWFREALDVFVKDAYPAERTETLLNYINSSWYAVNNIDFNAERYDDMQDRLQEVININFNNSAVMEAKQHILKLEELKAMEL